MKRRRFLQGAAAVGAASVVAACDSATDSVAPGGAPAVARRQRSLRMVTTWPKNFPGLGTSAERVASRIREITEGALDIRVYAAGELVGAFEAFDAVSSGTADMAHHPDYYLQGKSRAFPFFTAVPFGMTADEFASWIYFDGGQELWDELYRGFNAKPLLCANTGTQLGGWFRKEIRSLEDFRGLRIRMPGVGGEVMRRMGAAVVTRAGGEIFTSLQQGDIDAAEWVGPWNDMAFGLHRVAKHYYYPGFHEPNAAIALAVNLDIWNDLTPRERTIIEEVCRAEHLYSWCEYKVRNAEAQKVLKDEHGIAASPFPADVMKEIARQSTIVMQEQAAADPFTKRVYDSHQAAMEKYMTYGESAEHAYIDARRVWRGMQG